ncbi:MAG: Mpo1 family 2-hydroxy fatty acid dioxygenase [Acidiferrobacterales bacterium]
MNQAKHDTFRDVESWLSEYGESHQNATNKRIHWICVPSIYWSVLLITWNIPQHGWMLNIGWINWAGVLSILVMAFYLRLSPKLAIGMVLFTGLVFLISALIKNAGIDLLKLGVVIFVIAWIGQFIGHKIEGKKPSFFKDIFFLLIGPFWLMSFIYKRLGLSY